MQTVLIIDDEVQIRRVVRHALEDAETKVFEADNGRTGLDVAASRLPHLIILDLGLPDMSGTEVCRDLRAWTPVPIVVLSARHEEREKVQLLDAGADDYMTKPFGTAELQARVRAHLRRAATSATDGGTATLESQGVVIDFTKRRVSRDGVPVHLTPTEWQLLRVLAATPGRTLTHHYLFAQVWSGGHGDAQQHLRVHVANLRRKLERDSVRPRLIHTEPGVGYRFEG